ncbi:ABC transporter ATP-binding protein [Actinoplanes palleronii]|uniref:ABC transporter n=1 Tax=Actinoplanes palleronii TaxID=113570 RepID=A0ABQ4BTA5_9ACTN|nr:ABC transporter ATP-binding protein [Actinoplanes palleronii]GIE73918.1 ABC transporter [Actinoplanes palleronii]
MSDVLAVDAVGLTKTYGTLTAVDRLSLQVGQGEVYGVLGPNGAGKTTFLRMLFGLIRPDAGTLHILGRTWDEHGIRALDGVAGFIESPKFYPGLTGRKNLQLLAGLDGGAGRSRIDEVLETVDLRGRERDKVGGYSFGMRQRLGVAASLLRDPRLLVLDEPANGLDPAGIRDMRALVKRLAGSGLTVLLSSHDMAEVEEICDDVTIMRTGAVVYHGSIAALRAKAPEQAHEIHTTDDERAALLARAAELEVTRLDDGLAVRGPQPQIDALVAQLIGEGIALRRLTRRETPLEALFFMLTEPDTDPAAPELAITGAAR